MGNPADLPLLTDAPQWSQNSPEQTAERRKTSTIPMRELSTDRLASCVEELFRRMSAMYGRLFADMWAGSTLTDVKAVWAEDLAPFCWQQIAWAMEQCKATKDFPPTLPMFRQLCQQAPRPELPKALPSPGPDEKTRQNRAAEIEQQAKAVASATPGKEWARKLRKEWISGINLLPIQIAMASDALEEAWFVTDDRKRAVKPREAAAA